MGRARGRNPDPVPRVLGQDMDFELSEEQQAFREVARQFAEAQLAPHAAEWDEACHFPVPTLREAAKLGFAGICLNEAHGGAGLSRLDAALIFEELATGCTSTAGMAPRCKFSFHCPGSHVAAVQ
jgi:alkylation response protein AidB-like acyl-CoA dehydrogenase